MGGQAGYERAEHRRLRRTRPLGIEDAAEEYEDCGIGLPCGRGGRHERVGGGRRDRFGDGRRRGFKPGKRAIDGGIERKDDVGHGIHLFDCAPRTGAYTPTVGSWGRSKARADPWQGNTGKMGAM